MTGAVAADRADASAEPGVGPLRLAIIGGGPLCVYALERISAQLATQPHAGLALAIDVFERSGRFGAGEVNSDQQPLTSLLNRVSAQIGFAADESNRGVDALLPVGERPNFHAWAQARLRATGDPAYALAPGSIPPRRLHGYALVDMFHRHVAQLRAAGVSLHLHAAEVTDIVPADRPQAQTAPAAGATAAFSIVCAQRDIPAIMVDRILLATGNAASFARHAEADSNIDSDPDSIDQHRIAQAYPLQQQLVEARVPAGATIALRGLGLTAVDAFLYLSEGRGGRFEPVAPPAAHPFDRPLRYRASGREPRRMLGFSPSGMLPCCRPDNFKLLDQQLSYRGVYFNHEAIAQLRAARGVPMRMGDGRELLQLDFNADVLPLVMLELARAYYLTLFGSGFDTVAVAATKPRYREFLADARCSGDEAMVHLLQPTRALFDHACLALETERAEESAALAPTLAPHLPTIRAAFAAVLFAPDDADPFGHPASSAQSSSLSPWGHPLRVQAHRFDGRALFAPLAGWDRKSGPAWTSHVLAFLEQDLRNARQGNLRNPLKAACDGVLRDLRGVFCALVDRGGLTARSHARFLDGFMRSYHRLSNGAGIEATAKMLALIESGLVDLEAGPGATASREGEGFRVRGIVNGYSARVDLLIEGRLSAFDARDPSIPLYPNLLRRGLVRLWSNPAAGDEAAFVPGGLDLSERFHPYDALGREDSRLTVMGTPAEGGRLLQSAAARPCADSGIFNQLAVWARELLAALPEPRPADTMGGNL